MFIHLNLMIAVNANPERCLDSRLIGGRDHKVFSRLYFDIHAHFPVLFVASLPDDVTRSDLPIRVRVRVRGRVRGRGRTR